MCFGLSKPYLALRLFSISGGSRRWLENGLPGAICTMMNVMVRTMNTIGSISRRRRQTKRDMTHHSKLPQKYFDAAKARGRFIRLNPLLLIRRNARIDDDCQLLPAVSSDDVGQAIAVYIHKPSLTRKGNEDLDRWRKQTATIPHVGGR